MDHSRNAVKNIMQTSVQSKHRPIHFYIDNTYYFVTLRAIDHNCYFDADFKKRVISDTIQKAVCKFKVKIFAWVILDNHFHLLFFLSGGKNLSSFIHNINANISRRINHLDNQKGRKIFQNYWDWCVRDEKDFYQHFNYIHHNPVKHKYVGSQQKCCEYKFCSYKQWANKKGEEWLDSCFETYPIVDFTTEGDN